MYSLCAATQAGVGMHSQTFLKRLFLTGIGLSACRPQAPHKAPSPDFSPHHLSPHYSNNSSRLYTTSSLSPILSKRVQPSRLSRPALRKHNLPKLAQQQLRNCSCRRIMCRGHHATTDLQSEAIDVSKGREILPANVKPIHYHVTLEPNLDSFEYDGEVVIE